MGEHENAVMIAKLEEQIKTLFGNQREIAQAVKNIDKTNTNIERICVTMENMQKDIEAMCSDIDELQEKPSKRWEAIIGGIIGAIVAGLIAYFFAEFGVK